MLRLRKFRAFVLLTVACVFTLYYYANDGHSWTPPISPLDHLKEYGSALTGKTPSRLVKDDASPDNIWPPQADTQVKLADIPLNLMTPITSSTTHKTTSTSMQRPLLLATSTKTTTTSTSSAEVTTGTPSTTSAKKTTAVAVPTALLTPSKVLSETSTPSPTTTNLLEAGRGRLDLTKASSMTEPTVHWTSLAELYPIATESLIRLPSGIPKTIPRIQANFGVETAPGKIERQNKLKTIGAAFTRTWKAYKDFAWMHDELKPVTAGIMSPGYSRHPYRDPFSGWAATLVDSLDTLWIMGMKEDFEEAVNATGMIDFTTSDREDIPLFETVIRYLGGLLGAYDISGHKYDVLLTKAVELAEVLMGAFDTPNRMPMTYYHWRPDVAPYHHHAARGAVMAELGSLSVEFTRLAQLTQEPKFYDAIARITNAFEDLQNRTLLPGMWPLFINAAGCSDDASPSQIHSGTKTVATFVAVGDAVEIPSTGDLVAATSSPLQDDPDQSKDSSTFGIDSVDVPERVAPTIKELYPNKDASSFGDDDIAITKRQAPEENPLRKQCDSAKLQGSSQVSHGKYSLGGMADSTYEYLPKQYLLLGGLNEQYRTMYENMMTTVKDYLLYRPMIQDDDDILFTGQYTPINQNEETGRMNGFFEAETGHLSCFVGGMFGLGAKIFSKPEDMALAIKLTEGCVWAYGSTATGIMPESMLPVACPNMQVCPWNENLWLEEVGKNVPGLDLNLNLSPVKLKPPVRQPPLVKLATDQIDKAPPVWTAGDSNTNKEPETARTPLVMPGAPPVAASINLENFKKRQLDDKPAEEPVKVDDASKFPPPTGTVANAGPIVPRPLPAPAAIAPDQVELEVPEPELTREERIQHEIEMQGLWPGIARIEHHKYILRPEAIESVFYMYRLTGDVTWREKGWAMFEAIENATRTDVAYSAIDDVTSDDPIKLDEMESFWTAETLKYFWLLFDDEEVVSLDDYVLNTEAHPLRRPDAAVAA